MTGISRATIGPRTGVAKKIQKYWSCKIFTYNIRKTNYFIKDIAQNTVIHVVIETTPQYNM